MNENIPKIPRQNKFAKKWTKVILSGAVFGVVAAGSFQGVNFIVEKIEKDNTTVSSTSVVNTSSSTTSTGVTDIAKNCMPSIVSITNVSVSDVQDYFNTYGRNSRSNPFTQQETTSVGSGVIIKQSDSELDILTNYHVIENATTLTVTLCDDTNVEANVKGTDEDDDLAIISIQTSDLSTDTLKNIAVATMGSSDSTQVGEQVVAIGNALGYGQSVTTGIVSATNRSLTTSSSSDSSTSTSTSTAKTYIQTDAAINPGNSGGALLNMNGELIGINSAKLSDTSVEGMGYAIPIDRVSDEINSMLEGNSIQSSTQESTSSNSYYSNDNDNSENNSDSSSLFDFFNHN